MQMLLVTSRGKNSDQLQCTEQCLGVVSSAWGIPWHLDFSDVCAGKVVGIRTCVNICVGWLKFRMHVPLRWFPAQVSDCLCMPNKQVSLYLGVSVWCLSGKGCGVM